MNLGSIRRIDELGRIVIPKGIRKELKIEAGDNLEIYTKSETIIMEKHSELSKEIEVERKIAKTLKELLKVDVLITNKERIIIEEGKNNKEKKLPEEIIEVIRSRKGANIKINDLNLYISPIIVNGDIKGSLIIKTDKKIDEYSISTVETMTRFLIKYIE